MSDPCPFCGSVERRPMGARPDAVCARCGALERHRALVLAVGNVLEEGSGRRCLEAGPLNRQIFGEYLRERGWAYTSIDRWRTGNPRDPRAVGFVDHEADLTDLSIFDTGSFELFIAQHVIEEIPEYTRALDEIRRVLTPSGSALLEIPFSAERPSSAAQDPDRFGNVWLFGIDLLDELRRRFAELRVVPLREGAYSGALMVCRA